MNERIFVLLELLSRLIIHKCIVPSVDGGDVSGGMKGCVGDVLCEGVCDGVDGGGRGCEGSGKVK